MAGSKKGSPAASEHEPTAEEQEQINALIDVAMRTLEQHFDPVAADYISGDLMTKQARSMAENMQVQVEKEDDGSKVLDDEDMDPERLLKESLGTMEVLMKRDKKDVEAIFHQRARMARALFKLGSYPEALAAQRRLIHDIELPRSDYHKLDAYHALATMLGELKEHQKALKIIRDNMNALQEDGQDIPLPYIEALAWNLWSIGGEEKLEDAHSLLKEAIENGEGFSADEVYNLKVILANVLLAMHKTKDELRCRYELYDYAKDKHGENAPVTIQIMGQIKQAEAIVRFNSTVRYVLALIALAVSVAGLGYALVKMQSGDFFPSDLSREIYEGGPPA